MTLQNISPEVVNSCPHCGGKTGVKFYQHAYARFSVNWGNGISNKRLISYKITGTETRTVVCEDCGKRFRLIEPFPK